MKELNGNNSWKGSLIVSQFICGLQAVVCLWIIICMIIYGVKTRRWTSNLGKSSLSSGQVYIVCFLCVLCFVPEILVTEVMFVLPRTRFYSHQSCNLIGDITNITHILSVFCVYTYIWLLQRKIYTHPTVEPRIGKIANWFSRSFLLLHTFDVVAFGVVFIIINSFEAFEFGCIRSRSNLGYFAGPVKNLALGASLVIMEIAFVSLCIYPVVRISFDSKTDDSIDEGATEYGESENVGTEDHNKSKASLTSDAVKSVLSRRHGKYTGPIENVVKRTMVSSIAIVGSEVIVLIAAMGYSNEAPYVLRQTIYALGSLINVLCIVFTFPFANRLLISPFSVFSISMITSRSRRHDVNV